LDLSLGRQPMYSRVEDPPTVATERTLIDTSITTSSR